MPDHKLSKLMGGFFWAWMEAEGGAIAVGKNGKQNKKLHTSNMISGTLLEILWTLAKEWDDKLGLPQRVQHFSRSHGKLEVILEIFSHCRQHRISFS